MDAVSGLRARAESGACLSAGLLRAWSFWKGLVPGLTRRRAPPSRMYTCSGVTSSQRAPWKPERHTQVWGRLQEPRFWQAGWQSAGEERGGRERHSGVRGEGFIGLSQRTWGYDKAFSQPLHRGSLCDD